MFQNNFSVAARCVPQLLVMSVVSLLAACADFSGIHTSSELRSPSSVGLPSASAATEEHANTAQPLPLQGAWWQALGSMELNVLVEKALEGNPSMGIARARLVKAQAGIESVQAQDRPQLSAQTSVVRQHFNEHGLYPAPVAGAQYTNASAQLNGRWELDVFGRNRAALESAIGAARAAQADAQAAKLLLATQVVQAYIDMARVQDQLLVAQRTLTQRQETLQLVKQRFDAGLDTTLEVRQSEGGLPEARLQIEQLHEQLNLARNALAALTGQPQLAQKLAEHRAPTLSQLQLLEVPQTLPAELLGRRADVVAARWRVESASGAVDVAKAAFYPNVSLTAFLGLASLDLGQWINTGSRTWGVGPAISLPIFEGGSLRANLKSQTADYDEAVERYNQQVIAAVKEVTDQLTSLTAIARQQREQSQALEATESAYQIARDRYAAGLGNYLNVLTAESAVLTQQRLRVELQSRALQTRVALAHALGGGFQAAEMVDGV
ncbi:efflux transporter outer membrane subunit [Lampropedia puyangensis]|uniref:Efflux transporter outer membrane subunit n=2 Tax=Lampropedia puyangensis TaxID=1330072 RepID=A0A4S8F9P6_9BURK|nr:efflux transporter outer membrane subunit [Lampropedia puyangensis]